MEIGLVIESMFLIQPSRALCQVAHVTCYIQEYPELNG